MKIVLNGQDFEIEKELTIQELLEKLSIRPERVAVEVNLEVIKKTMFHEHILKDGDRVEIVNFVGGGQNGRQAHYKGY